MTFPRFCRVVHVSLLAVLPFSLFSISRAQGGKKTVPPLPITDADADHVQERSEWFLRGRVIPGKSSADLRFQLIRPRCRPAPLDVLAFKPSSRTTQPASSGAWTPLGPVPLASDATGNGFQNYDQVSGRAIAVAIHPADPTGNTVYIGGHREECGNPRTRPRAQATA